MKRNNCWKFGEPQVTKQEFDGFCKHKTIAIIGNAASVLNHENGQLYDSCDIVVRFNAGWPRIDFHKYAGSRTDIASIAQTPPNQHHNKNEYLNARYLIWPWYDTGCIIIENAARCYASGVMFFAETKELCEAIPSSGLLVLRYFVTQIEYDKLYVAGFDSFTSTRYYWGQRSGHSRHKPSNESSFLKTLLGNARDVQWFH